jgi:hypothetical protein
MAVAAAITTSNKGGSCESTTRQHFMYSESLELTAPQHTAVKI